MIAVIQRVSRASVCVDSQERAAIGRGLLVLLCVEKGDRDRVAEKMAAKIASLRIFEDDSGKMNRSLAEFDGEILAVSQFTLAASLKKGRRPSFLASMRGEEARPFFDSFVDFLRAKGLLVKTGIFGARMEVSLVNDGPVTFLHRIADDESS